MWLIPALVPHTPLTAVFEFVACDVLDRITQTFSGGNVWRTKKMHTWTLGKYHNEGGTTLVSFSLPDDALPQYKMLRNKVHCIYVAVKSCTAFLKSEKQLFGGAFLARGIVGSTWDLRNPKKKILVYSSLNEN